MTVFVIQRIRRYRLTSLISLLAVAFVMSSCADSSANSGTDSGTNSSTDSGTDSSTDSGSDDSGACVDECDVVSERQCNGNAVVECQLGTDGCNDLVVIEDCAASGDICNDSTGTPTCVTKVVEIGNVNYWGGAQNNPILTWDMLTDLGDIRPGTTVVWQIYQQPFDLTDLSLVSSRFDIATNNQSAGWTYGAFLLNEEQFNPVLKISWGWDTLSNWTVEGRITLAGVEIKLLKTWIDDNPNYTWDQNWWNNAVATNSFTDPLIREWNADFTIKIYTAWHQHMQNLGKKSAIIGLVGTNENGFSSVFENWYFPAPSWQYIIANYDLVFTYRYPRNSSEVARAQEDVRILREEYNYQGKIAQIMTTRFAGGFGTTDQVVALEEFIAVCPYVDVITAYPYMDVTDWNNPQIPYPPILIDFWENHGCSGWISQTP